MSDSDLRTPQALAVGVCQDFILIAVSQFCLEKLGRVVRYHYCRCDIHFGDS